MAEVRHADTTASALASDGAVTMNGGDTGGVPLTQKSNKVRNRNSRDSASSKRRCVSTACIACRRRKSKCDGKVPKCSSCTILYATECVYDPNSDHRRKGVYKEKVDALKTKSATLQILIQAILNAAEDDVPALIRQIRTCESLDDVADNINRQEQGLEEENDLEDVDYMTTGLPAFEAELSGKMGELRVENGQVRFIGGTSNLIFLDPTDGNDGPNGADSYQQQDNPLLSWTDVTTETEVVVHLINMYFTWHYPYFTTLSKSLFYREFLLGKAPGTPKRTVYCSSLLVNAMLALGCHFTSSPAGCANPNDQTTKGDHFFAEAKRLIVDNDEFEKPKLTTIQALCLMSVREAGCGREAKGWVYSGMAFRMAQDMGLNLDSGGMTNSKETLDEGEVDARRVTFWGCFLFDKCWSNYLGRLPQLPVSNITVQKFNVFPNEDADIWSPYTDNGIGQLHSQTSRTRTVALQLSSLCEISSDLLIFFYHPQHVEKSTGRAQELKKLSELQTRLEAWRKDLPKELEAKEGQLPNILLMQMFFHLLYIHLFKPFLKYNPNTSPLPAHVSPKKLCTQAAGSISKLMRLYKRTYGLRQICNIAVYIVHSACTIHLLNLPEKTAKRDIVHGIRNLEEIAEDWLCARRTLSILSVLARKWKVDLPEEASAVFYRTDNKFGTFSTADVPSPRSELVVATPPNQTSPLPQIRSMYNSSTAARTNRLQRSLYSYLPDSTSLLSSPIQNQAVYTPNANPTQKSHGGGSMQTHSQAVLSSVPYSPYSYSNSTPIAAPSSEFLRSNSGTMSEATNPNSQAVTRQVSPSTLFGGVDALVNSQDWWLRDQSNLAIGFDNWGIPNQMDGNATANANTNATRNGTKLSPDVGTDWNEKWGG